MRSRCAVVLAALSVHASARADIPRLAPRLYDRGNLRVAIACAGDGFVTPATGLQLTLDGSPLRPLRVNDVTGIDVDSDGNSYLAAAATDVGYLAPAGRHHLRIETPDCEADERDVELSDVYAEHVDGRLAAHAALRAPAVAPDGFHALLGGFSAPYPSAAGTKTDGLVTTAYTTAPASTHGVWLSWGARRSALVVDLDLLFGWGDVTGTVETTSAPSGLMTAPGALPYTASYFGSGLGLRIGAATAWHEVSLAAGSGLAGAVYLTHDARVDTSTVPFAELAPSPPNDPVGDWYVPMWTALTVKPVCNVGVEALASYDVRPTELATSTLAFGIGLLWEPSSACSEPPDITVSP